jgi:hypothetical protein
MFDQLCRQIIGNVGCQHGRLAHIKQDEPTALFCQRNRKYGLEAYCAEKRTGPAHLIV